MGSSPIRLLSALFLLATLAPIHANAQTFSCGTSDTTLGTPTSGEFYPFRPGVKNVHFIWRDTEFMWDALYPGGLTSDVEQTLAGLANNLVMTARNPFGAPYGDMQLIYEYFRREDPPYNSIDAADTVAMKIGSGEVADHLQKDRSHVDCYILHPTRLLPPPVETSPPDGQYPSAFMTADEDLSSERPAGYVRHQNSIHVKGPPDGQTIDVTGTGWTAPDKIHNVGIMHEFQHALPPTQGAGFSTELFSAAAEAVAGNADDGTGVVVDVPYTWPLTAATAGVAPVGPCTGKSKPDSTCVRGMNCSRRMSHTDSEGITPRRISLA